MQDESASRVITVRGVLDEYGIGISTQRRWRAEGQFVPWFRAGNRVVYRRELIEEWVEEQEGKTTGARASATPTHLVDMSSRASIPLEVEQLVDPPPRCADQSADPRVGVTEQGGVGRA